MKNITTSTWDDVRFQPQQKPKTSAPLFLQTKPYYFYTCCICSKISLTSATTMTQPQTLAPFLFNLLSSHLNQGLIRPLNPTYSCYLLSEKNSLSATVVNFLKRQVWHAYSQRNEGASAWCLWRDGGEGVNGESKSETSRVYTKAVHRISHNDSLQPPGSL